MRVAIVEDGGDIRSVTPAHIRSVLRLGRGSLVTLENGQSITSSDTVATLRRRLRALPKTVAGRNHVLRRLWIADIWRATRWLKRGTAF